MSSSQSVNIICREAVRHSFVSHLSAALRRQGIFASVFADSVSDDQIQGARVTVVVFSDSYTFASPWFDKLRKLLELPRNNRHEVISVLYGGNPLLLLETGGHQSGSLFIGMNNSSNMMIHTDSELVEEIVRDVYGKLFPTERIGIYSRLLKIENLLCDQPWDVRSLGIWGMPGIGKTTLAKAVFDQMSNDYDASCFIDNFDEALHKEGPHRLLQEKIGKTLGVTTSYITRLSLLKDKLCDTRILVVLDDVRNPLVAESFLGRLDWLGPGSLIIITSRYKQVFALCQISQIYEVQGLNEHEALHLFSQIAFEKNVPEQNDKQLSVKVIAYANGNPLALRIYGQELKRKESEMEAAFLQLKQCPPQQILDGLKSVCSALGDNEKYIFLDIACFFKGENVDYVVQLLKGCGYFPRVGIDILVEKCLVTISENTLQMNDLIQDIVREIFVREKMHMESCRTLWQPSSIRYLLEDDELKADGEPKETPKCLLVAEDVQGISLDTSNLCFNVNPDAFTKIVCLRFLKVYNSYSENVPGLNFPKGLNSLPHALRLLHWENYPFESLPQGFDLRNLVELNMPYSQLKILGSRTKNLEMLKRIRLCHSQQLVECDILLYAQNMELLDLQGCTGLKSFPDMSELQHLRVLNLSGCTGIKSFRGASPNIEELHLQGTSITEIPSSTVIHSPRVKLDRKKLFNFLENSPDVEHIDLECLTNLVKVASYNKGLGKLVRLNIKDCYHLQSLPDMVNLESLEVLHLSGCTYLEEIKGFPRNMKELYIGGTALREVPQLPRCLELLNAHGCKHLELIRFDFERLPRHYTFSNCFSLSSQVIYEFLEEGLTRVAKLSSEQQQELRKAPAVKICIPVDGRHTSSFPFRAGPNVMIELTPCTRKALSGFAMSIVVSFRDDYHNIVGLGIRCICTWTSRNGHSNKIERVFQCWAPMEAPKVECDHMFVFYDTGMHLSAGEENDPNISDDEIKFEFHTVSGENKLLGANCSVLECDVQVITAPTGDTSVGGITRQCEATSIIEEDTPPLPKEHPPQLPKEPEATSCLSSSEPRKDSSMPSTVRSKENVFGKWLGCFPWVSMPPKKLKVRRRRTRSLEEALEEAKKAAFEQALKIAALQKALFEKAAVEESKEKGTRKQLDDDQAEDKGQIKQSKDLTEEDVKLLKMHICG